MNGAIEINQATIQLTSETTNNCLIYRSTQEFDWNKLLSWLEGLNLESGGLTVVAKNSTAQTLRPNFRNPREEPDGLLKQAWSGPTKDKPSVGPKQIQTLTKSIETKLVLKYTLMTQSNIS